MSAKATRVAPTTIPTPMPAFPPVLRAEFGVGWVVGFEIAEEDPGDGKEVAEEAREVVAFA